MGTSELLKNKANYDPRTVSDKVLGYDHSTIHKSWADILKGNKITGWSKEDVYNAHALIVQEMERRGIKHTTPLVSKASMGYDQPHPAWKRDGPEGVKGPKIYLPSILSAFTGDYMIAEDFITVVGGLCNHGSTKGDIDVLLKCSEPKDEASPLGMATKFRISRSLAKIGIPEERIQYLYDDFSGPFTNHVHMFDLVLRLKPQRDLHEMSELSRKSVSPFRFVIQPKPIHGRYKEEIYTPETVVEVIQGLNQWRDALPKGVFVEQKFDGVRCQVHKVKNEIKIWTEEKTDVTNKLPSIVAALQKTKHDFVAEFELELWLNKKHQNRADTAAIIHVKGISPDEKGTVVTFYDLLWLNGQDIHNEDFGTRSQQLGAKIITSDKIKVSSAKLVKTIDGLKQAVKKAADIPGSEGAMIKMYDYKYPLTAHTSQMIKFKTEFSINVEVVEAHDVKGSKAKNYLTAIRDGSILVPCGRTYNTDIITSVGDAISVVFVELSKYIDPDTKKVWYNFWSPRVTAKAKKADSVRIAEELVKKSGGQVAEKHFPTRYKGLLNEDSYITEFLNKAILWDTEEFDFSLQNGWVSELMIPEQLATEGSTEIRNTNNFILKKSLADKAIICLRDENNQIKLQKHVCLVEV